MAGLPTLFGNKMTKIQLPIPGLKVSPVTMFQHRTQVVVAYAQATSLKFLEKVF